MGEETRERSFDELAKGLASGTLSRGKALRLMGAALVGGALASLPGAGWASHKGTPHGGGGRGGGGGKSSCAKYCKTLFGGDTAAQEECVSEGAQEAGPCYSCTPGVEPGPNFVTPDCPGGEFNTESCECVARLCTGGTGGLPCNGNATCRCGLDVNGQPACYQLTDGQVRACQPIVFCSSSAECPTGTICGYTGVCAPACGNSCP
jgi:hypothetical protein